MSDYPQLRPLSFGEVLDVSVKICTRHWRVLVPIAALLGFPIALASSGLGVVTSDATDAINRANDLGVDPDPADLAIQGGGTAIVALIALIATLLMTGALFRGIGDAYLGGTPAIGRSLSFGLRRAHSILWVLVLTVIGSILAGIALVLPGIWLYVAWSLAVPVLLTERLRGTKALGRSFRLVRHSWWRVFGLTIVASILASVVQGIFTGVILAVASAESDAADLLAGTVATTLGYGLTTPFTAAVTAVIYFDLRVRKEGFDLEMLARALEGEVGLDAAGPIAPGGGPFDGNGRHPEADGAWSGAPAGRAAPPPAAPYQNPFSPPPPAANPFATPPPAVDDGPASGNGVPPSMPDMPPPPSAPEPPASPPER